MEPEEMLKKPEFYFDPRALIERCPFNKYIIR